MRPKISVISLGVADLAASIRFYRDGLGFTIREKSPVAYVELEGVWLALCARDELASYIGVPAEGSGFRGCSLSCNVDTQEAVDVTMAQAQTAGALIVTPPTEYNWGGYAGWFSDPDGHLWEVVFNPRPFIP